MSNDIIENQPILLVKGNQAKNFAYGPRYQPSQAMPKLTNIFDISQELTKSGRMQWK